MFWIEGISRTPSGFVLDTLLTEGVRDQQPLTSLAIKPVLGRTARKRITTDCDTWAIHTAEPFLQALAIKSQGARDAHTIFLMVDQGTNYLIPSSVLLAAMMRPIKYMQRFLFKPHGLDMFSLPLVQSKQPSIALFMPRPKVFGQHTRLPGSLLASYSWMHCFPSARAMWDSVYQGATNGLLDVVLPKASIHMTIRSMKWQGYQLVSELVIMSIEAKELPFSFAADHPCHIDFHDSASIDWKAIHHPGCTIPARDKSWVLSDKEWHQITTIFRPSHRSKYDLRKIIDLILIKFGTGQPWRKLSFGDLNFSIVQFTYQQMKKNGRWAVLEGMLQASRRAAY